jgi:hypothetical protein
MEKIMKNINNRHFIVPIICLILSLSFLTPSYGQLFDDRDAAPPLPEIESFEEEGIVSREEFETIDGLIRFVHSKLFDIGIDLRNMEEFLSNDPRYQEANVECHVDSELSDRSKTCGMCAGVGFIITIGSACTGFVPGGVVGVPMFLISLSAFTISVAIDEEYNQVVNIEVYDEKELVKRIKITDLNTDDVDAIEDRLLCMEAILIGGYGLPRIAPK